MTKRRSAPPDSIDARSSSIRLLVAALINLGNVHYAQGHLPEALALYDQATGLAPDFFEAHYNRANVLHDVGRFEEACEAYREALTIDPSHADGHFYLAVTLEKLGASAEARPHWQVYRTLAPDGHVGGARQGVHGEGRRSSALCTSLYQ